LNEIENKLSLAVLTGRRGLSHPDELSRNGAESEEKLENPLPTLKKKKKAELS
jgi:hypothetical protein